MQSHGVHVGAGHRLQALGVLTAVWSRTPHSGNFETWCVRLRICMCLTNCKCQKKSCCRSARHAQTCTRSILKSLFARHFTFRTANFSRSCQAASLRADVLNSPGPKGENQIWGGSYDLLFFASCPSPLLSRTCCEALPAFCE